MRTLVLGSGGREHSLVWKLAQESEVAALPGNPGMACEILNGNLGDPSSVLEAARRWRPDLTVVGPENPLIDGLANALRSEGFSTFGPGADGAKLEASKAYTKEILNSVGAPTARFFRAENVEGALEAVDRFFGEGSQVAVKASGAALGKGVVVCDTAEQAADAVRSMMLDQEFGAAGKTLVIEERLFGREFSLLTLCSASGIWSLPVAQDFKQAFDGDTGPMTGGMGAFSPVDWVGSSLVEECEERVVRPTIAHLIKQGVDYRGVLFSGFMLTDAGPKCLEFNVRFGDPETQAIVRRLGSGFVSSLKSCAEDGRPIPCEVFPHSSVVVVVANAGYPGPTVSTPPIDITANLPEGVEIFHAGTRLIDGTLTATGGRVLNVSATGSTLAEARATAYAGVECVRFEGMRYRSDIAAETRSSIVH